jgi:glyoxylase-like metal-dependent hydrolase (beta-lactamase superfamily II)
MEIIPHLHRLETSLGDRMLCLYLLIGGDDVVLVDTGLHDTPGSLVQPYLRGLGYEVSQVTKTLISHADFDHFGGNAAWSKLATQSEFMCHELDRLQVENVELLLLRYGQFSGAYGIENSVDTNDWIRQVTTTSAISKSISEGDELRIGKKTWQVWHTPGHTQGHISLYEPEQGIALIQDAILGAGLVTREGQPAFPPTYRHLSLYRKTLDRLSKTSINTLLTAHYPIMQGNSVQKFLHETRAFIERLEILLVAELNSAQEPRTLPQLIQILSPQLGRWPLTSWNFLAYPLLGHLEQGEEEGRFFRDSTQQLICWSI